MAQLPGDLLNDIELAFLGKCNEDKLGATAWLPRIRELETVVFDQVYQDSIPTRLGELDKARDVCDVIIGLEKSVLNRRYNEMNPPSGNLVMRVQVLEDALGIYTDEHNQHAKATVAVDVDGDGEADYIVSGVDKDGDGIPDALQMGSLRDRVERLELAKMKRDEEEARRLAYLEEERRRAEEEEWRRKEEEMAILRRIAVLEMTMTGAEQSGSLLDRLVYLEDLVFPTQKSGDVYSRLDVLESLMGLVQNLNMSQGVDDA